MCKEWSDMDQDVSVVWLRLVFADMRRGTDLRLALEAAVGPGEERDGRLEGHRQAGELLPGLAAGSEDRSRYVCGGTMRESA